ncbi:MAG: hypothetical protein C0465_25975 [Ralstonia sp.]|nr:hypothetical protein [Ralstonia sp.]
MERYGLDGSFCMVIIKAGPDDVLVVAAMRGCEARMPELPDTFEGIPIERMTMGRPVPCPATRRTEKNRYRQGDDDGPWSFTSP